MSKKLLLFLTKLKILLIILFSLCTMTVHGDISTEITKNCHITSSKSINNIIDGRYSTNLALSENDNINIIINDNIRIKGDKHIKAIYVLWDTIPSSFSIKDSSGNLISSYNSKDNIFLHQLIKIDKDISSLELTIDSGNCKIAEIYVFSDGYLPEWVQDWKEPYEKADMLLLPTHADDEHLFFGGTMPYYAGELKLKVQVAYLTNHYNFRVHELLNGLWSVGIRAYPIIPEFYDYYASSLDEAKKLYNENEILGYQVELLRRFKPYVVIGHDLNGEYGHGVHMLNAHSLTKALEISSDNTMFSESAKKYGVWDVPKCYLHLYKNNRLSMNWDVPLKRFNNTAFEMAVIGFSKHISQQEFFSVGKKGVFDCRAFGLYRSTVGEDKVKNDFLENINIKTHKSNKFSIDLIR